MTLTLTSRCLPVRSALEPEYSVCGRRQWRPIYLLLLPTSLLAAARDSAGCPRVNLSLTVT